MAGKHQNSSETQVGAETRSTPEHKEELCQCCPYSVSACQHPFVDSQRKLLEPALVSSAMLLVFLIKKIVSTYSSPDGSLTVFSLMMGLHNLLLKL